MKVALNDEDEWVVLPDHSASGLYIDGYLKSNFDIGKREIRNNWDMIFAIDGYEGSGKSVLTQQLAFYCDPSLCLDRVVFNPEDFKKAIDNAQKFQAVVYDEAYGGLSSKGAMTAVNRALVQKLTVIRRKNLFVFIVAPTFFDLVKYIAIWRTRALINVYADDNFKRGFFKFYDIEKKKDLYLKGKDTYDYRVEKPNFYGRFTNVWVIDEEEYDKKKEFTSNTPDDNKGLPGAKVQQIAREIKQTIALNLKGLNYSQHDAATILSVTDQAISRYVKTFRDPLNLIEEKKPMQYETLGN
jgi:hypothetical protein